MSRRVFVAAITLGLIVVACGSGTSETTEPTGPTPEETLLVNYAEVLNSGDMRTLNSLFKHNPVVKRHPFAANDYMDQTTELRATDEAVAEIKGSGAGLEFFNINVYEGDSTLEPDVTFSWRFHYGADGSESGGEAGCIGGTEGKAFVTARMFTEFNWGFRDETVCDT